ncbi:MAG TPA: hypothetical protein VKX17_02195 [Planctomycetota bacterium]|nr:hypothetical protein [Planctomycetota bacterium]
MHRIPFVLPFIIVTTSLFAGQDAPPPDKPLTQDERSMNWLIAVERLRTLPRAGDIQTAGILANIGDIVETTPEQKAAIAAALKAYDAALVQKTAQWENEMKAIRAECEAKIIAALPEARRDAAKKALDFSHENWVTPFEFEAQLRAEYIHKKAASENKATPPEELEALKKELQSWIKEQRQKAAKKNSELVEKLRSFFDPKEAARLDDFDKNKEAPPKEVKKAK